MYVPEMFSVDDPQEVDGILATLGFGCLVTRDAEGFFGTHIPMQFDPCRRVLTGHVAKGSPHRRRSGDGEALAIFDRMNAYISPNWYPSKFEHGQAVPTWNYEVVHVAGRLSWHDDADRLLGDLKALVDRNEERQVKPWLLTDAPEGYLSKLMSSIVGLELEVREVQVKRKLSQNRTKNDRLGVISGLLNSGNLADHEVGQAMARGDGPANGEL